MMAEESYSFPDAKTPSIIPEYPEVGQSLDRCIFSSGYFPGVKL